MVRPAWSYRLNADFEDHAEHEYALLVQEHGEWDDAPFVSAFAADYAELGSVADLFRQISYDERVHKNGEPGRHGPAPFRLIIGSSAMPGRSQPGRRTDAGC
jgi:ubiquinol oxidase